MGRRRTNSPKQCRYVGDRDAAGTVQVGEAGKSLTTEDPVDGRGRYTRTSSHQMRAFLLDDSIRDDPAFHLRRHKDGCGGKAKTLNFDSDEVDTGEDRGCLPTGPRP